MLFASGVQAVLPAVLHAARTHFTNAFIIIIIIMLPIKP
jgi:hypothetical protein